MKSVGVIGGMGPRATNLFLDKFYDLFSHLKDNQFPRVLIDNDPHLPSRNLSYLKKDDLLTEIFENKMEYLHRCGAELFVFPCNSAHFFIRPTSKFFNRIIQIPILVEQHRLRENLHRGLILGAEVVTFSSLYDDLHYYKPINYFDHIRNIIDNVKEAKSTGCSSIIDFDEIAKEHDCDHILLACTELSYQVSSTLPVVDTNDILAKGLLCAL